MGIVVTVGVGAGGNVGGGGKVGAVVTVGDGVGDDVVGVCINVAVTVILGVGEDVGVGVDAGVGVTAYALSVVKSQLYADSIVVPAQFAACTFVVTVAVYFVPYERAKDGVKVIVAPFVTTEPLTLPSALDKVKDSVVTVKPFTYILKVADAAVVTDTPVASLDGLVELMVSSSVTPPPPPPPELDVVKDVSSPYTRLV